ncbi:tail virion protein G7P-2 [Morganella morganii]|nr:tail virion protein G7P-2 [Morganella morganii]MDE2538859.1 tail virion protein G7P-2 [Morganella morganii]
MTEFDLFQVYKIIFEVGIVICFSLGFIAGGQR